MVRGSNSLVQIFLKLGIGIFSPYHFYIKSQGACTAYRKCTNADTLREDKPRTFTTSTTSNLTKYKPQTTPTLFFVFFLFLLFFWGGENPRLFLVLRWSLVSSLRLRRPRKLGDRALRGNGFIPTEEGAGRNPPAA